VGFVKAVNYFSGLSFHHRCCVIGFLNRYFNVAACQASGNFVAKTVFWGWCAWSAILIILDRRVKSVYKRSWVSVFRQMWFCRSRCTVIKIGMEPAFVI